MEGLPFSTAPAAHSTGGNRDGPHVTPCRSPGGHPAPATPTPPARPGAWADTLADLFARSVEAPTGGVLFARVVIVLVLLGVLTAGAVALVVLVR